MRATSKGAGQAPVNCSRYQTHRPRTSRFAAQEVDGLALARRDVRPCGMFDCDEFRRKPNDIDNRLQRMSDRTVLDKIAQADPNERICLIATPSLAKPHRRRLEDFLGRIRTLQVNSREFVTWVSPEVMQTEGKRPKSAQLTRRILELIHALVKGA
jgi:hypothetical protein